ncbi:hypothetical protein HYH03_011966 [Edaphochlamys debaryana]|uniref:Protein kinase domain-containing protein n=1 Tax=Edaphochlamys debaryana TaxID=47281 RepID=A0A835XZ21_9CHLO|nr:hypothetical protein HYH03_011966 [Edaphochlamys debaryana]|eukprot:KAG2489515.1 hypothetical protein HYH03_011966 [Edaphochlamys debaryana]
MAQQVDLGVLDSQISEVDAKIGEVEAAITATDLSIRRSAEQLAEIHAQLRTATSRDDITFLREQVTLLSTKEVQLRREKVQLRTKEEQLRREKELLLKEKDRLLGAAASEATYAQRWAIMNPPSQISWRREQLDLGAGPLLNNWRPNAETAAGLLPELAHPAFANAVDNLAGHKPPDDVCMKAAAQLCCVGARIYDNESGLTAAVRKVLEPVLTTPTLQTITSGFADLSTAVPDWAVGDSSAKPDNLFLIFEAKAGIGGSGDSHYQGACYHGWFWRGRKGTDAFRDTRCPAFLLEVVGPHVRLSAVFWLERVTLFPLTPLLNLLPAHPVTDSLVLPVARLLAALRQGLHEIAQVPPCPKAPSLPWPIATHARYIARSAQRLTRTNFIYVVSRKSPGAGEADTVVVRLCRSYGTAAHKAWADQGFAPAVLHVEQLPAGWQLVEMEWLPPPEWRQLSQVEDAAERSEALDTALEALSKLHAATGAAHGDARPPNCLVRREGPGSWQVKFVDFEMSGEAGVAKYPAFLNDEVPWPEGVAYGQPLRCEHDSKLLSATVVGGGRAAEAPGVARCTPAPPRGSGGTELRCKGAGPAAHALMVRRGLGWRQRSGALWAAPAGLGARLAL